MSSSRSPRSPNRGVVIGNHRLSASCGVVERHDRHCGDDFVSVARAMLFFLKKSQQNESPSRLSEVNAQDIRRPTRQNGSVNLCYEKRDSFRIKSFTIIKI